MLSLGDWRYTKNFDATIFDDNNSELSTATLYTEGVKVGDAAQTVANLGVDYRINSMFAVKGQLGTVYLEDFDNLSTNPARMTRSAHFRNYVNELSLRGEVNLFSRPMITRYTSKLRVGVNTYAMLGVTGFVHNPQAQLDRDAAEYHYAQGNITTNPSQLNYDRWYDLRDVGTEKLTYGSASLGFPLGLGASFMVNYQFRVGLDNLI